MKTTETLRLHLFDTAGRTVVELPARIVDDDCPEALSFAFEWDPRGFVRLRASVPTP